MIEHFYSINIIDFNVLIYAYKLLNQELSIFMTLMQCFYSKLISDN